MIDKARKGLAGVILMEKSSLDFHPKIYISSKFSLVWAGKYFSVEKIIIFLDFIMPHFFFVSSPSEAESKEVDDSAEGWLNPFIVIKLYQQLHISYPTFDLKKHQPPP